MNIAIKNSSLNESTLIWAVICSILLHILFFVVVPNFKFDVAKKIPDSLVVELVQPKKPEPVPEPILEPIQEKIELPIPEKKVPEPIKPKEIKPEPIQKPIEPNPEPVFENIRPEANPEPVQIEPQVPTVIAVEPKPEAKAEEKPAFVAPTPQPEPARGEDVGAAKSAYIKSVHQELKRNHRYPKLATMRGIQGEAKVEIRFDDEGNVISTTIVESSGSDVLDEGALATVKRSNFKKYMNKTLVGHLDTLIVPIVYTLN